MSLAYYKFQWKYTQCAIVCHTHIHLCIYTYVYCTHVSVYINSWQLMEPLTRIITAHNCVMVSERLLIHSLFTVQFTKLCEWFSMYRSVSFTRNFSFSFSHVVYVGKKLFSKCISVCVCVHVNGCMRDWKQRDTLSREVEWTSAEYLFASAMYDIWKRYSNFRASVHISKLFTCGCTNLIKSFTWA